MCRFLRLSYRHGLWQSLCHGLRASSRDGLRYSYGVMSAARVVINRKKSLIHQLFIKKTNNSSGFFSLASLNPHKVTQTVKYRVGKSVNGWFKFLLLMMMVLFTAHSQAQGSESYHFDIPAQSLHQSIKQLSNQTRTSVLFPYHLVEGRQSHPVKGAFTVSQALNVMLINTELVGGLSRKGVLMISLSESPVTDKNIEGIKNMNMKKKVLASTIAFFMGSGAVVSAADQNQVEEQDYKGMEEIVVTATKRSTSLQDTSIAISVLSEDNIEKRGLVDMGDYLAKIPGASYIEIEPSRKQIILRGLSLGLTDTQNTASAYLGEIPISSAVNTFDVALVDIERIEVIKGPQGTLFGSNSLGGLVRTIPNAPNLNDISGNLKLDFSTQDESDDSNHSVTGVFNLPLIEDQLALRVSAYNFSEAGYIDIVSSPAQDAIAAATGSTAVVKEDSNSSTNKGVRASLLWQPTESLKVGLIHGVQKNDVDNTLYSLASLSGYQASYLSTPNVQATDLEYNNLTIEYNIGWATILSSSSVVDNETGKLYNNYLANPNALFGPIDLSVPSNTNLKTQEIRLTSNLEGQWEYVAGLFYEKSEVGTFLAADWIGNVSPFGAERLLHRQVDLDYKQKAVFGELSYAFSEQWLLTLGGRHFQYDRVDTTDFIGEAPDVPFNGGDSEENIDESGNIYKASLAFTPNENTLIYGQWSEGFRLGKGQQLPGEGCDVDPEDGILDGTDGVITARVESDTTESLELGLKLSLLDNRLVVNTAVFKTDWDNLPVAIQGASSSTCLIAGIINNIGSAESQGIEVEATYLLNEWAFSLSASYLDTARTNARPPLEEGERLPLVPRTNASVGIQYNFNLNEYSGFIRTDISYVGTYASDQNQFTFPDAGDYVDASLHLGITMNHWDLTFYGSNLTGNDDARFFIGGNFGSPVQDVSAVPRKLGVKVSYSF